MSRGPIKATNAAKEDSINTNIQPTCPNCQQPAAGPKTVAVDGRATPVFTCHNDCKTDCAWVRALAWPM